MMLVHPFSTLPEETRDIIYDFYYLVTSSEKVRKFLVVLRDEISRDYRKRYFGGLKIAKMMIGEGKNESVKNIGEWYLFSVAYKNSSRLRRWLFPQVASELILRNRTAFDVGGRNIKICPRAKFPYISCPNYPDSEHVMDFGDEVCNEVCKYCWGPDPGNWIAMDCSAIYLQMSHEWGKNYMALMEYCKLINAWEEHAAR